MEMFPSNTGISEVRGVVKLIKDSRGHSLPLYVLSQESSWNIAQLLPTIEACKMLGFTALRNGSIRLTKNGERLQEGNFQGLIRSYITRAEPFKTVIAALSKQDNMTTHELSVYLRHKNIAFMHSHAGNEEMLRHTLLKWAVRCQVLGYNVHSDRWYLKSG